MALPISNTLSSSRISERAFLALVFLLSVAPALCLAPYGVQYFDEGTQMRFAQQALGISLGPRHSHPYIGFEYFYGLLFRLIPLGLLSLRIEVALLLAGSVTLAAAISRNLLSRVETVSWVIMYVGWQSIFGPFAYYSREANFAALAVVYLICIWVRDPSSSSSRLVLAGLAAGTAISFKFNVGILISSVAVFFLATEAFFHRRPRTWLMPLTALLLLVVLQGLATLDDRAVDLFGGMLRMPISYARTLGSPIRPWWALLLLTGAVPFASLWKANLKNAETRILWFWLLLLPAFLLQDVPRHWVAHVLWVPMPYWWLACLSHRLLWPSVRWRNRLAFVLVPLLALWGFSETRPWQRLQGEKVLLTHPIARGIRISPQEAAALEELCHLVHLRTNEGEGILVLPAQPMLFALCERTNRVPWDNVHGGVRFDAALYERLTSDPAPLILIAPEVGPWGIRVAMEIPRSFEWLRAHYRPVDVARLGHGTDEFTLEAWELRSVSGEASPRLSPGLGG